MGPIKGMERPPLKVVHAGNPWQGWDGQQTQGHDHKTTGQFAPVVDMQPPKIFIFVIMRCVDPAIQIA